MAKKEIPDAIAAFDLSLASTGVAACSDRGGYIGFRTFKSKYKNGMARLDDITNSLVTPAKTAKLVVMEDMAFAAHDMKHERAGLAYLVRHGLWQNMIPYVLIAPTSLKKFVTGSGKAEKSMMIMEVFKRWGHAAKNDNEADAIALLYIGQALMGCYTPETKAQREVLQTVCKSNAEAIKEAKGITKW